MKLKKEKKEKEKKVYILAITALIILLIITLYHAYNMEHNCEQICNKQIKKYEDLIKEQSPENLWRINHEQNLKNNWNDSELDSVDH